MREFSIKIGNSDATIDFIPNECPYCHKAIRPDLITENIIQNGAELIFKCPSYGCERAFIATYQTFNNYSYFFQRVNIGELKEVPFSPEIANISPSFIKIYNEAFFAEQHNLFEICGVGYRKSLEFLVKDYLISKNPSKAEVIKKKFLGNCIKENVTDTKIKAVAERAVWLGNDETHYVKLWEEKTLHDLKRLISLTVHWIEMEELTQSFEEEMSTKK